MWIPDWLYRILPIIYATTAMSLLMIFGLNGPSLLSVVLLFTAATLTALWRREERDAKAASPKAKRPPLDLNDSQSTRN